MCWKGTVVAHRRKFERPAIWILLGLLVYIGLARATAQPSQDYINGSVEMRLTAVEHQIEIVQQRLDYILLAVAGGFIAQLFQVLSASRARGRGGRQG